MPTLSPSRLQIHYLTPAHCSKNPTEDGHDVVAGLTQTQKTLPPKYFYDDYGSQLFEKICELPEYYPTRTEAWILQEYADAIAHHTGPCDLVELGSGSSTKTRLLFDAYQRQNYPLYYQPIDVSAGILAESAQQLLTDYPTLQVHGQVGTYEQALANLPTPQLDRRMVFFLGSSLGNFTVAECDRFFEHIFEVLDPGDFFLLGIDLQKESHLLEAAYNDAQGVTAAFNLNMLTHLNHRFGGNFDRQNFYHRAIYNEEAAQIEMHLHCKNTHTMTLKNLNSTVSFVAGETIRTEISRKFTLKEMQQYLQAKRLPIINTWTDPKQWFGILLCQR
ncbi:MAG: L-histidine N(alpha)-methyltransferase [Leptolyngbyaceae bacterium]|nr:L-histidine N(alpha)-methyltransferase [Leptolyngbyaceae bacterium]